MTPQLLVLGVSHHHAPLAVRERFSCLDLGPTGGAAPIPAVLLATCNRMEVYTATTAPQEGHARLEAAFTDRWGGPREELAPYLERYTGEEAARHLFRVAAGLDSLVLGEAEILGQVGSALRAAVAAGTASPELVHLFHHALRVGRRARAETGISRHAGSVSSAAVGLAQHALGDLAGCRVLVIGAGEAARLSARALREAGAADLLVANRTPAHAAQAAAALEGQALPWGAIPDALATVDVVVTATGAPGYLLTAEDLRRALHGHATRRMVILDVAVPRDVEPAAAEVDGVTLYNVDSLQAAVDAAMEQRRRELQPVEAIIEEELARFRDWWRAVEVYPTIRDIHSSAEDLRRREVAKALEMLPDLSPADRAIVEALSRSLVRKVLHDPVTSLKDGAGDAVHVAAARRLFRLPAEGVREPR